MARPSPTLADLNSRPGFTRRNPSMETHAQCGFADSDRFGAVFLPPRPDAPVPRLPPSPMGHGPARHGARPSTRSGKVPGASARWPRLWRTPVGVLYSHPGSSHWWTVVIAPGRSEGGAEGGGAMAAFKKSNCLKIFQPVRYATCSTDSPPRTTDSPHRTGLTGVFRVNAPSVRPSVRLRPPPTASVRLHSSV
jgi:hypothetical protein